MTHLNDESLEKIADAISGAVEEVAGEDASYVNMMLVIGKDAENGNLFTTAGNAPEGLQNFILYISDVARRALSDREFADKLHALMIEHTAEPEEVTFDA